MPNIVRLLLGLAMPIVGFFAFVAVLIFVENLNFWVGLALFVVLLGAIGVLSAMVGDCGKCGRSLTTSPSENWHTPILWWSKCPRCGTSWFASHRN